MKVFRPNGTNFWHYEFVLNGKRYHKSTKLKNEREALKVANAAFTAVVKSEAGIAEAKPIPNAASIPKPPSWPDWYIGCCVTE